MPHSGVEAKPAWREMPAQVRAGIAHTLGVPVARAMRVWGGYGPTPTFRLRLADGGRAFCKAAGPAENDFIQAAFGRELRVYRELGSVIGPWAPRMRGAWADGAWRVLLLEDLGPKCAPPWSPALARNVLRACAAFHDATSGKALPAWVPREADRLADSPKSWRWAGAAGGLDPVIAMAGDRRDEARAWLHGALPLLARAARAMPDAASGPQVLLHGDIRSDNLRWRLGRLYLVDWPHVRLGPAEEDVAEFAQSISVEGGPDPDTLTGWYQERRRLRPRVLDGAVARWAGFFAGQAWRPEIPGLPRLRAFQRGQLRVCLRWAAARLGLPAPGWADMLTAGPAFGESRPRP